MKKTWIALSAAACTFPAVAVAVPMALNTKENNPNGTDIILSQSTGSMGTIGATVVVSANSQNLFGNIQWKYPSMPQNVSVQGTPSDNNIVFRLNSNVNENTSFNVVAENNGITSNIITISVNAPIDILTINYVEHNYLSYANDLVTIRRVDINAHHSTIKWYYTLPETGHVSVIQENDTEIIFKANRQIISHDGFFNVHCTNNSGDVSNTLPVALIPPQTTINLTFQDGRNTLSGRGNVVTIKADMINPYGNTVWHYDSKPTTVQALLQSNGSISFTNPEAILTGDSNFQVWAENNGGTSNIVNIKLMQADIAKTISVIGEGIVYDGYRNTYNPHISAAYWQAGNYEYTAQLFDDDGNPDAYQDPIFEGVRDDTPEFIAFTPEVERDEDGRITSSKLIISWNRDADWANFDDPVVVHFTVTSETSDYLEPVDIYVNIDFYSISNVSWVGAQPSTLTGTHGSAQFNAIVNGVGKIGDKFIEWDIKQQNGAPLPPDGGDWIFTEHYGIPNDESLIFGWIYTGTVDATLNLVVTAISRKDTDEYITTNVTLNAKKTTGVTITGDQYIKAYTGTPGSKTYSANYSGIEPDTNTTWSILTIDGVDYNSSDARNYISLTVNSAGAPVARLEWDNDTPAKQAALGSYIVVLQAQLINKPEIVTTYPVQLHVAGAVASVNVTWDGAPGKTSWSTGGETADTISVPFAATVIGEGGVVVDQDVVWSYNLVSTSGGGRFNCSINGDGVLTAVDNSTSHVSGTITITATSKQNTSISYTTGNLSFTF